MAKTAYHSHIRDMGEVEATVLHDRPQPSKFKGKSDWIGLKINGEEYNYSIENDQCGEALTGLKGKTVLLRADGTRDDATIEILSESAAPAPRDTRTATRPPAGAARQPAAARRQTPEERAADEAKALLRAKMYAARCSVLMQVALKATIATFKSIPEMHSAGTEDIRATANTLFIELKGITDINGLPTSYEAKAPKPVPAPAPEPEPEPEPEPPMLSDEELEGADDIPFS